MTARVAAWLSVLCCALMVAFSYGKIAVSFDTPSFWRVVLFAALGLSGFLSIFLFPQFNSARMRLLAIWIPAVLVRLLLLPAAVSDDVSRYLFEGKLVRAGISPYAQTADAESIAQYRDAQWSRMNHKDKPTAYPPLAQLVFAAVGAFVYDTFAYKLLFVLVDLLTLRGVLKLLEMRGLNWAFSGFYALNPVVLVAFAGEAHFDSLMIAALVWAVFAYETNCSNRAMALVSIATGIKWIALPLIPFFGGRRFVPGVLMCITILGGPAVFFFDSISSLLHGLFAFGGTRNFNGMLYDWLLSGFDLPRVACNSIIMTVFAMVIFWRWVWRARASLDAHLRWILGTLLVVSPTVHFWYLAWIMPFICLRPSLPWLTFSLTAGSYFFVWANAAGETGWSLQPWQERLFWGPFLLACVYEVWSTKGRALWPGVRSPDRSKPSFAVVVPALNAAATLHDALSSIERQTVASSEVIVVDAGSTDETVQVAINSSLPVRVLYSERGRGVQIAKGIGTARADWVIVLHADAVLAPDAIACLSKSVEQDRTVIGGAFGQRFKNGSPGLLPIELLNDFRVLFARTAFGDQAQFFHRETALRQELMPSQLLMEDVESSWRIREYGGFLFLNQPCQVSRCKWKPKGWFKRVAMVIKLTAKYRWARSIRGHRTTEKLSEELYSEYYLNE